MTTFPAGLEPVDNLAPAAWVEAALKEWPAGPFRVRDLVPPVFEAYARILHRPYRSRDGSVTTGSWGEVADQAAISIESGTGWRELESARTDGRDLEPPRDGTLVEQEVHALAALLVDATTTPEGCSFAVWSGWGFLGGASALLRTKMDPLREALIRARERLEARRERRALARLATFELLGHSGRGYFLVRGAVRDVERFRFDGWFQSPSLWWPDDRAWFVHTEVDAYSTYIGGTRDVFDRLVGAQILESFEVEPDGRAAL